MGAKEVAAGAAWLDENFPGWEREIDLGTLDLNDCGNCICGQSLAKFITERVWSGYDYALAFVFGEKECIWQNRETDEVTQWALDNGFYPPYHDRGETEILWRELIKERFSSGNLSDN